MLFCDFFRSLQIDPPQRIFTCKINGRLLHCAACNDIIIIILNMSNMNILLVCFFLILSSQPARGNTI